MTVRPSWFRCDAARLLGSLSGMKPDAGYIYTVILLRIYEVGGPIPDDEIMLSRRTGLNPKRVAVALAWLVKYGKVERLPDGRLDSKTTHAELSFREKSVNNAKIASKSSLNKTRSNRIQKTQTLQQNVSTGRGRQGADKATDIEEEEVDKTVGTSVPPVLNYRESDDSLVNEAVDDGRVEIKKPKKDTDALRGFGEQWNALAAAFKFPAIDEIKSGSTRERHALARLREMGPDGVQALLTHIRGSPYLRGEVNGFRVTFDWIVNPTNYQKIMEGNYENRKIASFRK